MPAGRSRCTPGRRRGRESVWQAIEGLGATRIGHAVRAGEDPALLDAMAERGVGIEANLTSNVQTSTVPDYVTHPLKSWLDRGLLATINSHDPGISAIDLPYEYEVAAPAAGRHARPHPPGAGQRHDPCLPDA